MKVDVKIIHFFIGFVNIFAEATQNIDTRRMS